MANDQAKKITLTTMLGKFGHAARSWLSWLERPPLPWESLWIGRTTLSTPKIHYKLLKNQGNGSQRQNVKIVRGDMKVVLNHKTRGVKSDKSITSDSFTKI